MFSMISKIFFMLVFVVLIICLGIILPAADNNIKEMEKPTTIASSVPPRAHRIVNSNQKAQQLCSINTKQLLINEKVFKQSFSDYGITTNGLIMVCGKYENKNCVEYDTLPNTLPLCADITNIVISGNYDIVVEYKISNECVNKGNIGAIK